MKYTKGNILRVLCAVLALLTLCCALVACGSSGDAPDGYLNATCSGEYFRLFVPQGWTVNTRSGVSGASISMNVSVSMEEVLFSPVDATAETDIATDTDEAESETEADNTMQALPVSLRAFVTYHVSQLEGMREYTLQKAMVNTLGGQPAWDITYGVRIGANSYRIRQLLTMTSAEQERFYVFTYTAPADESFNIWMTKIEDVMTEVRFETFPYEGENERKIPVDADAPEGMKLVSTGAVAYRFYAPEGWIVDNDNGHSLVYASAQDRSNVSVVSYLPAGVDGITVEEYWAMCKEQYENDPSFGGFTVCAESKDEYLHESPALVYEFTYTMGGVDYKCRQVMAGYSGMVYIMTYTAVTDRYDTHIEEAKAMQNALTFRKPFG